MLTLGCNFWAIEIMRRMKSGYSYNFILKNIPFLYTGRAEKYTYTARTSPYSLI